MTPEEMERAQAALSRTPINLNAGAPIPPVPGAERFVSAMTGAATPLVRAAGLPSVGQAVDFAKGLPKQVRADVRGYLDEHPGNVGLANAVKDGVGILTPGSAFIPDLKSNPTGPAEIELNPLEPFQQRGLETAPTPGAAPLQDPTQTPARPVVAGGAPGGYGGTSMSTLKQNVANDQKGILGSFEQDKALKTEQGQLEQQKLIGEADLQAQQRARYEQAQQIEQQREQLAQQKAQEFAQASQKLNDEISQQKIDPMRLVHNADTGTRATMMVGGILGGMLEAGGYTKDNPYIAKLERDMASDVKAQESAIANKRAGLNQRDNLFAQFRAISGDARLASLQAQDAMMKSAQMQLQEYANRSDAPLVQQRAKMGVQAIEEARQQYQLGIDQHTLTVAQQQAAAWAAQQNAAANLAWERAKWVAEHGLKVDELKLKEVEAGNKALKEQKEADKGTFTFPDGTKRKAVSEEQLNKFAEFQAVVPVIKSQIGELKQAYEKGDRTGYEQLRRKLIDSNPDVMGRSRAPSMGEAHGDEGTVSGTIPTYDELQLTDAHSKLNYIPGVGAALAANRLYHGDATKNLDRLDRWVDEYAQQREQAAFGEKAKPMPGSFKADK